MNHILTILASSFGAAVVTGIFTLIQHRQKRKEEQEDKKETQNKALRYLMLYVIQERAKQHIKDGCITLDERRSLHHWHSLYHNELGGNGDADALMAQVDGLSLDTNS